MKPNFFHSLKSIQRWYLRASTLYDIHSPNIYPLARAMILPIWDVGIRARVRKVKGLATCFAAKKIVLLGKPSAALIQHLQPNFMTEYYPQPDLYFSKLRADKLTPVKTLCVAERAGMIQWSTLSEEYRSSHCFLVENLRFSSSATNEWHQLRGAFPGPTLETLNTGLLYPAELKGIPKSTSLCSAILKPWRWGVFPPA